MITRITLILLALGLPACQVTRDGPYPERGPTSPDVSTPSNYHGSSVTSPQM